MAFQAQCAVGLPRKSRRLEWTTFKARSPPGAWQLVGSEGAPGGPVRNSNRQMMNKTHPQLSLKRLQMVGPSEGSNSQSARLAELLAVLFFLTSWRAQAPAQLASVGHLSCNLGVAY